MEITDPGIPRVLKLVMVFIDRVGFPVLAFILMFFVAWVGSREMTKALEKNTAALTNFSVSSQEFQKKVSSDHQDMKDDLKIIILKDAFANPK